MESANTKSLTIVGFTGKAGSGKDHMARSLWSSHGFMPLAFADFMKELLAHEEGIPVTEMLTTKSPRARTRLQIFGTEEHRARDQDVWVRALGNRLFLLADKLRHHRFAITDVRFQNETDWIHQMGGFLVWLKGRAKELTPEQQAHSSENYDPIDCDYIVDNSLGRGALAEEEVRQIILAWVVANSPKE